MCQRRGGHWRTPSSTWLTRPTRWSPETGGSNEHTASPRNRSALIERFHTHRCTTTRHPPSTNAQISPTRGRPAEAQTSTREPGRKRRPIESPDVGSQRSPDDARRRSTDAVIALDVLIASAPRSLGLLRALRPQDRSRRAHHVPRCRHRRRSCMSRPVLRRCTILA